MLIVVCGPGGVGKGTVVKRVVGEDPRLWLSRSWTTRQRRPGEPPEAYVFVTRDKFLEKADSDGFLEWAEFQGNLYGTPVPDAPTGTDVLLEIEVQGASQVLDRFPEAVLVLIDAPSVDEQEARLRGRGDSEEQVLSRLAAGREERAIAADLGARLVVNDDLDEAVSEVRSIIQRARDARNTGGAGNVSDRGDVGSQ